MKNIAYENGLNFVNVFDMLISPVDTTRPDMMVEKIEKLVNIIEGIFTIVIDYCLFNCFIIYY
jgi:hypothetical protein